MVHRTNGDAAAARLRRAGLPGEVIVWADVLHDGPVRDMATDAEWRDQRVAWLAGPSDTDQQELRRTYEAWDARLAAALAAPELVLWFEHDLFDQLLLIRHLAWLSRQDRRPDHVSLVCIDRHPSVPRFAGLGQLAPEELAALFPSRETVTSRQSGLGQRAWRAFTSSDPSAIVRLLEGDTCDLPFLEGALSRHFEEFPSTEGGLPRTERQAAQALARRPTAGAELFREVQTMEERVYMGDLSFYWRLLGMSRGMSPIVETDAAGMHGAGEATFALTPFGFQVLEGRADWIQGNGIDRWLGGVHLRGDEAAWRWDPGARRLVSCVRGEVR
jgi:hypothetical protein